MRPRRQEVPARPAAGSEALLGERAWRRRLCRGGRVRGSSRPGVVLRGFSHTWLSRPRAGRRSTPALSPLPALARRERGSVALPALPSGDVPFGASWVTGGDGKVARAVSCPSGLHRWAWRPCHPRPAKAWLSWLGIKLPTSICLFHLRF